MSEPVATLQLPEFAAESESLSHKSRWLRVFLWTSGALVVFILLAVTLGTLWLRSAATAALPQLDGNLHLAGLSAPVSVLRDTHGVPHIEAATEGDLFFAQGYVTAQDRLWQMDILRRNASGELAEILGPTLLVHDKAQRVFQLRPSARRIYAKLTPADRARLDAYARGVNLFISQHQDSLPPEFKLLFYRPRPWTGEDSILIGLLMVQNLDTSFPHKIGREHVAAKLNNSKLESDLYPVGSWRDRQPTGSLPDFGQPQPKVSPAKQGDEDDEEDDDRSEARLGAAPLPQQDLLSHSPEASLGLAPGLSTCAGCNPGSNNWVVAGSHTASGKPLLSNDMHLGLSVPNIWYIADLHAPGFHAAGVTLPGLPFIVAGHNEHVAWGFTALYADTQDVYIEKLDGRGNYRAIDGNWQPLAVDHEVIRVRGGRDVKLDVQSTAHGPLLNPLYPKETRALALKWTLYDSTLNAMPLYQLNTASNWTEFTAAVAQWCWPTQNIVYSDDQGHIGYHAIGSIPIRSGGLAALPTAADTHAWQGFIPFDQMPSAFDPPSGFLATANARVTTDKSPYQLTLDWASPYRVERIYKSLQGRDKLTRRDMLALQTDVYSEVEQEMGNRFAYAIDHTTGANERLRMAASLMRNWDGRLTADSAAASLVAQTRRALWPLLLEPKLGKEAASYSWSESDFAEEEIVMHANSDWLPPGFQNWDALLTEAVRRGMENGQATTDPAHWRYGIWHTIDLEHPLSKFLPDLFHVAGTGAVPMAGDTTTVQQVGNSFGPSQRFTMDWSNIDRSTENIVLGESGNPLSPYFRDQWSDWYSGSTFALPFTPSAVATQTRHTLRLLP
jgi:penicillin G amidase